MCVSNVRCLFKFILSYLMVLTCFVINKVSLQYENVINSGQFLLMLLSVYNFRYSRSKSNEFIILLLGIPQIQFAAKAPLPIVQETNVRSV